MKEMGISQRMPSFYYEKVAGRQEGKSVYRLHRTAQAEEEENEFDLAKNKLYIKDFDFTEMSALELEIVEQLRRFQNSDFTAPESPLSKHFLNIPQKRFEDADSINSVGYEGRAEHEKYSVNSGSTYPSTVKKGTSGWDNTPPVRVGKNHLGSRSNGNEAAFDELRNSAKQREKNSSVSTCTIELFENEKDRVDECDVDPETDERAGTN